MRELRAGWLGAVATVLVLGAGSATGQPAQESTVESDPWTVPVRIDYRAPAGCPSEEAFFDSVRSRTARVRLAEGDEPARTFLVVIMTDQDRTFGELRVTENGRETDSRMFSGVSCEEVVDALSLTAALSVDPDAKIAPSRPVEPRPEPKPVPPPEPPPIETAAPKPEPPKPPPAAPEPLRPEWFVGLDLMAGTPVRPYTLWGAGAMVELGCTAPGLFAPSLRLSLHHAVNDLLQTPRAAHVAWTPVTLTACPLRFGGRGKVQVRTCALVETGVLYARGEGVDHPASVTRSWWAAGISARGSLELMPRLLLEIVGSGSVPLVSRGYVTEPDHWEAARTNTVAATGSVGLALGLP